MTARSDPSHVLVVNPLPRALHHYTAAFVAHLVDEGVSVRLVTPDLEIGGRSRLAGLRQAIAGVALLVHTARSRDAVVVLWPIFGFLELLFWGLLRPRHTATLIVMHDPAPLRRQHGQGRLAAVAARLGVRRDVQLVAHTRLAADALGERRIPVDVVLPHPVAAVRSDPHDAGGPTGVRELLVAGQFKAARDTMLLGDLVTELPGWELAIAGRGWPDVAGWHVDARFLTEDELDARLRRATVVLLPYAWYFQSGIAVRAFELGVPVVGARHEFLESMYGPAWPGLVDGRSAGPAAWADAITRVAAERGTVPTDETRARIGREWSAVILSRLEGAGKGVRGRADR